MADFAAMNAVWDAWVPQGETPARATVEATLAHPTTGSRSRSSRPPAERRHAQRRRLPRRSSPRRAPRRRLRRARAATLPVTRAMFDEVMVPLLRAGAVHPGARRRLARVGPAGPHVHRLRQRRRGDVARPLPSRAGPRARRSRRRTLWHVSNWFTNEPALRLAQAPRRRTRSPSACSSATPVPRPTRRR